MKTRNYDVIVFGGGVSGLMTTAKLSKLGLRVLLVEKERTFAFGPSTRNAGWLHSGAYQAGTIADRKRAVNVARHCAYGYGQIARNYPEAIQSYGIPSHVLVRDDRRVLELVSRWQEAGIECTPISLKQARHSHPGAAMDRVAAVFESKDVTIDTRLLYRRILQDAMSSGAEVMRAATAQWMRGEDLELTLEDGSACAARASMFVYASGHENRSLVKRLLSMEIPLRYWKSHMLIVPRLSENCCFHVDPGEVAIVHHSEFSLINHNNDATQTQAPNYEVRSERVQEISEALKRLFPGWTEHGAHALACVKADFCVGEGADRSLGISIYEPAPGHICIFPGKMTEAPYLTDALVRIAHARLDSPLIASRPMDDLRRAVYQTSDASF